jgi:NTP pyrophosphatase (non-canonical NTP hydrolase)
VRALHQQLALTRKDPCNGAAEDSKTQPWQIEGRHQRIWSEAMSYSEVEMKLIQWGEARKIIQNGTAISQAIKTLEETTELLDAINRDDMDEIKDAVGDIVVTLIMVCAIKDIDLVQCLEGAYQQIKNRRGHLTPQGTFIKQ